MTDPNTPQQPEGGAPQQPSTPPQAPAYPPQPPAYPQAPTYGQAPTAYGEPPAYPQAPGYAQAGYGYAPQPKTNTLAIVSLIFGIAGLVVLPLLASIVAVITGHISLNQLKTSGENGRGLGLTGTILGWVGVALGILSIIVLIVFLPMFLWAISESVTYTTT